MAASKICLTARPKRSAGLALEGRILNRSPASNGTRRIPGASWCAANNDEQRMNRHNAIPTVSRLAMAGLLFVCVLTAPATHAAETTQVDFQRDVRPILSSMCFHCHGPDEADREADLRLDTEDGLSGGVVVPGDPDASELIDRITSDDEDMRMPPPDSGKELSSDQVEALRQWIQQGAAWSSHWAFQPPVCPPLPKLNTLTDWGTTPIDAFVAERLEREGIEPGETGNLRDACAPHLS